MARNNSYKSGRDPSASSGPGFRPSEAARKPSPAASRETASSAPRSSMTATAAAPAKAPTPEQIAERARTLWKASGCQPNRDQENWLEAERQLRAEMRGR